MELCRCTGPLVLRLSSPYLVLKVATTLQHQNEESIHQITSSLMDDKVLIKFRKCFTQTLAIFEEIFKGSLRKFTYYLPAKNKNKRLRE